MGLLTKLLASGYYGTYNRFIAKVLGIETAILLGAMFDLADGFGNGFYCQQERLMEKTCLTKYSIGTATKNLVDHGMLTTELKGIPAKLCYTLNESTVFQFLENEQQVSDASSFSKTSDKTNSINSLSLRDVEGNVGNGVESNGVKTRVRTCARFVPPTVEEVVAYCQERRNGISAQAFVDFYTSKGWLVGKTPMKDWKAAVRTWEQTRDRNSAAMNLPRRREAPFDYD